MDIWKLRLSMAGTLALIIGLSTLFFTVILTLTASFDLITLGVLVGVFNIVMWLVSPYLIGAMYRVRAMSATEQPKLHEVVDDLSKKCNIKTPRLMLAQIPLPNAFAYGSPIAGTRIAVTSGLLTTLNDGEVAAVIGHELGHLRHRDVQIMMFVSLLPAVAYYIGFSLMLSGMFGGNQKNQGSGAALGIVFMAFSFIMNLFILNLSRLREYYADRNSASIVDGGSQKLSTGLAKIVNASKNMGRMGMTRQQTKNLHAFKALFITDPDHANVDSAELSAMSAADSQKLVQEILSKKLTTADRIQEVFSTHPNIVKRLRALQELA
ncbi:MAG: zinc metalloprotease HtpX [Candidatus Bathyarchaeia archaeon]|jgi:heat shock protein HtpX